MNAVDIAAITSLVLSIVEGAINLVNAVGAASGGFSEEDRARLHADRDRLLQTAREIVAKNAAPTP